MISTDYTVKTWSVPCFCYPGIAVSKIDSKEVPVYVECKPNHSFPQNECFSLDDTQIKSEGGRRILGWQIWQGQLLIEAEFHAVWETPEGDLVDITPKALPFDKILFVPDPGAKYEGKQVNNIRINITGNPLVDEFISVHNAVFRIENKGKRAFQYELSLPSREANALYKLNSVKPIIQTMAMQGCTRNSPCMCGSEKKYKACHGKAIRKLINNF